MAYQGRHLRATRRRGTRATLGLAGVAVLLAIAPTTPTFSAFSATTANPANTSTVGTVALTDNDAATAMFAMSNLKPGDTDAGCIQVTSTGTLPSLVRLYGTTTGSGLDAYLTLTITRGSISSGSFDDCAGFTPDAANHNGLGNGVLYSGTLAAFGDSWAAATVDPKPALPEAWTTGETHAYKLTLTVADDNNAQGLNVTQAFTFEARNTTLYSQVILSDTPASYWKLDETSGASAADSAGSATGTYTNGPTLNQPSAVKDANTAVSFDDTDDSVSIGDVHDFAGTASFSVELWLRPTAATAAYRRVISKQTSGRAWGMELASTAGGVPNQLIFVREDASNVKTNVRSVGALQAGVWYHIVVTYDGATMRLYMDGALADSTASTVVLENHTQPLTLGRTPGGAGPYGGLLDEVAIYTTVLSQQQAPSTTTPASASPDPGDGCGPGSADLGGDRLRQNPSRASSFGSPCHSFATLTRRSR